MSEMDWTKDLDLTGLVDAITADVWAQQKDGLKWDDVGPQSRAFAREAVPPFVTATVKLLAPAVAAKEAQAAAKSLRRAADVVDAELGAEGGFMPCCTTLGDHRTHECNPTEAGLSIPDWLRDRADRIDQGGIAESDEVAG